MVKGRGMIGGAKGNGGDGGARGKMLKLRWKWQWRAKAIEPSKSDELDRKRDANKLDPIFIFYPHWIRV